MNLKPCPCGKIPNSLLIADNGAKWAYVFGDCCNEWHIEFRTSYNPIDSDECMKLATEAWNLASRVDKVCTVCHGARVVFDGVLRPCDFCKEE